MSVTWTRDGALAVVLIDNPPVNATSHAVRVELLAALSQANEDSRVGAIVLACAGRTFVAGADVKEFGAPPRPPFLTDVTLAIENSAKPVIAALHGTALGGGLEIALAAHFRIGTRDTQCGLPEVTRGLIPGAGGTQRLPRLIGIGNAIDIIASGRRVGAAEAASLGLLDHICKDDLLSAAKHYARSLIGAPVRRTGELPVPSFDAEAVAQQMASIRKKARGQVAPVLAAQMVCRAAELNLADGLREERAGFLERLAAPEAQALGHVFAAERNAAKVAGVKSDQALEIRTVGVVGVGLMGAGIAIAFLDAGFPVRVVERDETAAAAGRQRIEAVYARMKKSGRINEPVVAERLGRLGVFADRTALGDCDLVVEAVFDDLAVKRELFAALSAIVRPDAILATNTSYLDANAIAAVVDHPERFLGLHFFSPANVMRLVEVVRTADVSLPVLATALAVVKRLGKVGVVSGVCEGFIGNRIFTAYRQQCDYMLEEGALPHEIDAALEGFGFPMGPYAVNDLAGLDISWARRKRNAARGDPGERYVVIADRLCEAGRLGQKTGKGYYRYDDGQRSIDPEVTAIIETASREAGIERRRFDAEEILSRVAGAIVAEGRKILDEGIALRASDIDLVMIHGYGYPAWRGGPIYRAGIE